MNETDPIKGDLTKAVECARSWWKQHPKATAVDAAFAVVANINPCRHGAQDVHSGLGGSRWPELLAAVRKVPVAV